MPCASSSPSNGLCRSTWNDAPLRLASVIVTRSMFRASSGPYIRGAVAPRVARLVAAGGAVRLASEVDEEIRVDRHAAVLGVAIDHHHASAVVPDIRIELVVPGREQGGGDVEPLAVERQLDHLRTAGDAPAVDHRGLVQKAAHPDLAREPRLRGIGNVVLTDVPVQPVAEI